MAEYIERENYCKNICLCNEEKCDKERCSIHTAPTADVVEVKHGEWIKVADLCGIEVLKCSVCGMEHPRNSTAFCCDCGAKMDGKKARRDESNSVNE